MESSDHHQPPDEERHNGFIPRQGHGEDLPPETPSREAGADNTDPPRRPPVGPDGTGSDNENGDDELGEEIGRTLAEHGLPRPRKSPERDKHADDDSFGMSLRDLVRGEEDTDAVGQRALDDLFGSLTDEERRTAEELGILNPKSTGQTSQEHDDTQEMTSLFAPHDRIWTNGHLRVDIYDDNVPGEPALKFFRHRNTADFGMTLLLRTPTGKIYELGADDIVQVFYRDADGNLDLSHSDVFQGASADLPEGFTIVSGEGVLPAKEEESQTDESQKSLPPRNPILAAIANATARLRNNSESDDGEEFLSKTDTYYSHVVYRQEEGEEVRLVTPDGTLIIGREGDRVVEKSVSDGIPLTESTLGQLALNHEYDYFAL